MQKSENKIKQMNWGWDGSYDYSELRQYYKRFLENELGEEVEIEELVLLPAKKPISKSTKRKTLRGFLKAIEEKIRQGKRYTRG